MKFKLSCTWIALVGVIALLASCGKKAAKKEASFKPGKLVKYENNKIGFAIMIPDNLEKQEGADKVTFSAKGFPKVEVTFEKTKDTSGRGGGGSSGMGTVTRKLFAPLRKLTCHCADAGKYEALVKKICGSMENTKEAPKNPSVQFDPVKVEGALKNKEAYIKGLIALKDKILQCWKDVVAKDAKFPAGHLNFMVTFAPDGNRKSTSVSRTFNYAQDKLLSECVEKLVFSVKPEPDDADVKMQWYLRFKLY